MALLSPLQIYAYAKAAGFTGSAAVEATAVALAESSGSTTATSRNPDGGTNVGLMQLDTPGGKGAGYSVAQLQDPATNMRVAHAGWASDGGTFNKSWSTATNGAAAAQVPVLDSSGVSAAAGASPGILEQLFNGVVPGAGAVEGAAGDVASAATSTATLAQQAGGALQWLSTPANWGRIALVAVGGVLVVVGLGVVARPVVQPVVKGVAEVSSIGK